MQIATYCATPAALAPLGAELGEAEVVAVLAWVLGADVVVAAVLAVEPLELELLLLPHPATSAPQSSAAASNWDRLPIIGPP
ncbi:MAG: hypothetical protein ACLPUT_08395 [Solirubrobacteraceae bacterium]